MKNNMAIADHLINESVCFLHRYKFMHNLLDNNLTYEQQNIIQSNSLYDLKLALSYALKAFYIRKNINQDQIELLKYIKQRTINYHSIFSEIKCLLTHEQIKNIESIIHSFNLYMSTKSLHHDNLLNYIFDKSNILLYKKPLSYIDNIVISLHENYDKKFIDDISYKITQS